MQSTKDKTPVNKKLERLVRSNLRSQEDIRKYSMKLKKLANEWVDQKFLRRKRYLLKALANETRLQILHLLSIKEMCVCELEVALDLTQPTASHHLNILEKVDLITNRKEGKWVFYRIEKPRLLQNLFDFLELQK
jgi:ArsR family transcriptional regulator